MNALIYRANIKTHVKIVVVAVIAALLLAVMIIHALISA